MTRTPFSEFFGDLCGRVSISVEILFEHFSREMGVLVTVLVIDAQCDRRQIDRSFARN
jgi:hypothetical protein